MNSNEEFFSRLQGDYKSFADLRAAANEQAVQFLRFFPPRFDMEAYLDWAVDQGWIIPSKKLIKVSVTERVGAD